MHALLLALVFSFSADAGMKGRIKKLNEVEFDHYYALRSYLTEDQKKTWLKLKTEDERNAWLKEAGHWDRFYKYDPETRAQIIAGKVELGWTKDMLEMSWGTPFDKQRLPGRQASRSELWVFRFEGHEDGSALLWEPNSKTQYKATRLFLREVILDDDKIADIAEKNTSF